jgi:hypothetical protein
MATSQKSKKRTHERSSARSWKRNRGEDVSLPSGEVALIKRPGPAAILAQNILPDTLQPIVQQAVRTGRGLPPEKVNDIINTPEGLASVIDAMDRVMVTCVLEPKVAYHKRLRVDENGAVVKEKGKEVWEVIPEDERDTDTFIYTDEVEEADKMFIFNYAVGGTRDLERFRGEQQQRMGDLSAVRKG